MNFSGFVSAGLQLGLESIVIKPTRGIYGVQLADGTILDDIIAQAVIEEHHHDELEITDHPVQYGAAITDHAFKRPAEVTLKLGWSNSPSVDGGLVNTLLGYGTSVNSSLTKVANIAGIAAGAIGVQSSITGSGIEQIQAIYQSLLKLQESRALFVLYTGKRVYTNMLCRSLTTESDFKSANSLPITMSCKQVILVNTQTVSLEAVKQANASETASIVDDGTRCVKPVGAVGQ